MEKLVYMFRHKRPIAIGVRGQGVFYPRAELRGLGIEPIPGREAQGIQYEYQDIIQVPLLPEQPDPLPESLNGDADLVREFKLSQARQVAENIKINERIVNDLKSHEAAGNIELLGKVLVDSKGNMIPKKEKVIEKAPEVVTPVAAEPVVETTETAAEIPVPEVRRGRTKKQAE